MNRKKLAKLRATQTLLQKAHDYIEANGFDIMRYAPRIPQGACCYIGSVRVAAGLCGAPVNEDAGAGDGPELKYAFKVLDRIAKAQLNPTHLASAEEWEAPTGRFIEQLGFQDADRLDEESNEAEATRALEIFRQALTKVYKEIEEAEQA